MARVVEAMFLKIGDQVTEPAIGTVSSVEPLHHPACPRTSCGGLCRGDPRVIVRFGDDNEYIFRALTEFEIHRADPEPAFRPDLLEQPAQRTGTVRYQGITDDDSGW